MPSHNEKVETVIRAHDLICGFLEFQGLCPIGSIGTHRRLVETLPA